ncbi:glutamine--fructose-6-phosphate transaminase (isomerizing) [Candidatus Woesearchaeota archaeon]|nr:glutamine--fructose-6-phosphate transaminase (isomerizing) [Candidatus Woesearchaeota archaeon]
MCGIFGIVGSKRKELGRTLLKGIKRLEYRGYDSVGMAALDKGKIKVKKAAGAVDKADKKLNFSELKGHIGITHSRWSTHGGVTDFNAHPHQSCDKNITIVHNGIIENYEEIKSDLIKKGHKFRSETDSEVIAHYFEEKIKQKPIKQACVDFLKEIEGTFAVLMMKNDEEKIYALKRDSPLVLGICEEYNILGSDIYAFSDRTDKAVFFDNDEFAVIEKDKYQFYDTKGKKITKKIQTFVWEQEESLKEKYPHFMIKEIMEEPRVVKRLLMSLKTDQKDNFNKFIDMIIKAEKVIFAASGTSYHAALLGVYYFHRCSDVCGIEAQALIASEFEHFANVDSNTLVIAVSQSGETMDVIEALKFAKKRKAKIASMVNVPYSSIQRMSDISLQVLAGQEICVAATKSFVNQVTLLLSIAKEFGFKINLDTLSERIEEMLAKKDEIKKIAKKIYKNKDLYVLGRGLSYPVAREVALKIKEISYIHAEGMMGGELKHGTIALIEKGTPVISLISNKDYDMLSNTKEVEARGAKIIKVTNEFDGDIKINTSNDGKFGVLAAIFGQLLTYYMALELNLPVDKPRNLAKSVTVK